MAIKATKNSVFYQEFINKKDEKIRLYIIPADTYAYTSSIYKSVMLNNPAIVQLPEVITSTELTVTRSFDNVNGFLNPYSMQLADEFELELDSNAFVADWNGYDLTDLGTWLKYANNLKIGDVRSGDDYWKDTTFAAPNVIAIENLARNELQLFVQEQSAKMEDEIDLKTNQKKFKISVKSLHQYLLENTKLCAINEYINPNDAVTNWDCVHEANGMFGMVDYCFPVYVPSAGAYYYASLFGLKPDEGSIQNIFMFTLNSLHNFINDRLKYFYNQILRGWDTIKGITFDGVSGWESPFEYADQNETYVYNEYSLYYPAFIQLKENYTSGVKTSFTDQRYSLSDYGYFAKAGIYEKYKNVWNYMKAICEDSARQGYGYTVRNGNSYQFAIRLQPVNFGSYEINTINNNDLYNVSLKRKLCEHFINKTTIHGERGLSYELFNQGSNSQQSYESEVITSQVPAEYPVSESSYGRLEYKINNFDVVWFSRYTPASGLDCAKGYIRINNSNIFNVPVWRSQFDKIKYKWAGILPVTMSSTLNYQLPVNLETMLIYNTKDAVKGTEVRQKLTESYLNKCSKFVFTAAIYQAFFNDPKQFETEIEVDDAIISLNSIDKKGMLTIGDKTVKYSVLEIKYDYINCKSTATILCKGEL